MIQISEHAVYSYYFWYSQKQMQREDERWWLIARQRFIPHDRYKLTPCLVRLCFAERVPAPESMALSAWALRIWAGHGRSSVSFSQTTTWQCCYLLLRLLRLARNAITHVCVLCRTHFVDLRLYIVPFSISWWASVLGNTTTHVALHVFFGTWRL